MKLIDVLAGTKPDEPDPMDEPSGVRLTIEPSKRVLEVIDLVVEESVKRGKPMTRESAAAMLTAGGAASLKLVDGFYKLLKDGLKASDERTDKIIKITRDMESARKAFEKPPG